ncbi:MAG: polyprenyl synthetase family protein [Oscillospiraceae bacterium]|nr:polyprenyl synthetase family protein [Oscillospiraceae bacterium]
MTYEQQFAQYLAKIEERLPQLADGVFESSSKVGEAAKYSLLAGGKRIRAVLCVAVCDMLNGNLATAVDFGCAVEMLHCYSLIHDDLPCMDNDDFRRGKPSCHIAYGESTALLAADALLTAAFEVISCATDNSKSVACAVQALSMAAGAKGMVYGQELDLYYEKHGANEQQLCSIHRHKTGDLINAAAQLGAIAADANSTQRQAIANYAYDIGLVFQIIDDILDVTSTSEELGKPIGSDAENGKTTFITLKGLTQSRELAANITTRTCNTLDAVFGLYDTAFLHHLAHSLLLRKS